MGDSTRPATGPAARAGTAGDVYEPRSRDTKRAAVIILPGGSYRGLSIVKEGHDVARAFNELGITAFVLKYRTPSDRHMLDKTRGPLQDAQRPSVSCVIEPTSGALIAIAWVSWVFRRAGI